MVKVLVYLIQVKKKNKVVCLYILKKLCTGGGARTPTLLKEMDFESTASTDFATLAERVGALSDAVRVYR